jgi:hypothetical protein
MRVFDHFNSSCGAKCPVCNTSADAPTVLVPIPGIEDGGNVEAKQVHKECYDLAVKMQQAEQST